MNIELCEEMLSELFEEMKVNVTEEQVKYAACSINTSFGMYSEMETYAHIGPSSDGLEIKRLEEELKKEKDKISCSKCKGNGRIVENFGFRSSNSSCHVCNGEGKV